MNNVNLDEIRFYHAPGHVSKSNTAPAQSPVRTSSTPLLTPFSTPLPLAQTPVPGGVPGAVPGTTPYTPITIPSHEASPSPAEPEVLQPNPEHVAPERSPIKINTKGRTLNEEELLILLNHVLELRDRYNDGTKSFWKLVSTRFTTHVRHSYSWQSCKSKMETCVRRRKAHLSLHGVNGALSPTDIAVDRWIDFLQYYSEQGTRNNDDKTKYGPSGQQQRVYRDGLLRTMNMPTKRRAQEAGLPDDDPDDSEAASLIGGSSRSRKKMSLDDMLQRMLDTWNNETRLMESMLPPDKSEKYNSLVRKIEDLEQRVGQFTNHSKGCDSLARKIETLDRRVSQMGDQLEILLQGLGRSKNGFIISNEQRNTSKA
jgi:hypothetical protein